MRSLRFLFVMGSIMLRSHPAVGACRSFCMWGLKDDSDLACMDWNCRSCGACFPPPPPLPPAAPPLDPPLAPPCTPPHTPPLVPPESPPSPMPSQPASQDPPRPAPSLPHATPLLLTLRSSLPLRPQEPPPGRPGSGLGHTVIFGVVLAAIPLAAAAALCRGLHAALVSAQPTPTIHHSSPFISNDARKETPENGSTEAHPPVAIHIGGSMMPGRSKLQSMPLLAQIEME
mmetsp:Transcript_27436/g.45741  ORF Transcript_27436/g.45741 Transcript_27436/m.45741 type:complete len:230 (+) Transcript_27436:3-692(+)